MSRPKIWRRRFRGSSLANQEKKPAKASILAPTPSLSESVVEMRSFDIAGGTQVITDAPHQRERREDEALPAPETVEQAGPRPSVWRMGLVVTASALCGGIAVVLWNRRLLTHLREIPAERGKGGRPVRNPIWEDDL